MPRKGGVVRRDVLPDPIYNSKLVTRLINKIMLDGKKGTAEKILYTAFNKVEAKTGKPAMDVFATAFLNAPSRSFVKNLIEAQKILVNGSAVKAGYILKDGDKVEFLQSQPEPIEAKAEEVDFKIVYEDPDLLVVDKPQGLVVHPCQSTKSGTLVNGLLAKVKDLSGINGKLRPGIVHRLDKNTSGLMLVAKNDFAHVELAKMIKEKSVKRKYLALLDGIVWENSGHIENFLARDPKNRKKYAVSATGKLAISNFVVKKRYETCSLVEFSLVTGRTHQIRVHAAYALGCPIIGDRLYGTRKPGQRLCLHASQLSFIHPQTKEYVTFDSKCPF